MLTSSISHQVSCRLIILAAQTVASRTVLYGGVILKATPFAMLVVSSFPLPNLIILFALLSDRFWGVALDTCLPDVTGNLLISFPFSTFKFKEGGCTSCYFSWFLAFQ